METLKRFSSTLSSQIKELSVKVSSKDVWGRGILHSPLGRDSYHSFSAQFLCDASLGDVHYQSDCLSHDFVLQIEDAIINMLLDQFNLEDLPQATSAFTARAAIFGGFDLTDSVYSASQIGTIRSCIRTMVSHDLSRLSEQLEAIFLCISSSCDKKISIISEPLLMELTDPSFKLEAASKQISFRVLSDESFASVIHMKMLSLDVDQDEKTSKLRLHASSRMQMQSILVVKAGSTQVHGLYNLVPSVNDNSSSSTTGSQCPQYCSADGYVISRTRKKIQSVRDHAVQLDPEVKTILDTLCGPVPVGVFTDEMILGLQLFDDKESSNESDTAADGPNFVIYQWTISNPSVASCYYKCCTLDPSHVPPSLGWRPSGSLCHGKLPGPYLTMVTADVDSDRSDSEEAEADDVNGVDGTNLAVKTKSEKSEAKRTREKERRSSADTVAVPIDAFTSLETGNIDSISTVTCNDRARIRRSRRCMLNSKIQKRQIIPTVELISSSPGDVNTIIEDLCCLETVDMASAEGGHAVLSSQCMAQDVWRTSISLWSTNESNESGENCRKQLSDLVDRCTAAEILQRDNIDMINKRLAWLTGVTAADELLSGCSELTEEYEDSSEEEMIKFEGQWDLNEILHRAQTSSTVRQGISNICTTATRVVSEDIEYAAHTGSHVTHKIDESRGVRKVASMPTLVLTSPTDRNTDYTRHRRTQSQSIYQMPIDPNTFMTDDESDEELPYDMQCLSPKFNTPSTEECTTGDGSSGANSPCLGVIPSVSKTDNLHTASDALQHSGSHPRGLSALIDPSLTASPVRQSSQGMRGSKVPSSPSRTSSKSRHLLELNDLVSMHEQQCYTYSDVDVIGVEMRGSGGNGRSNGHSLQSCERAFYVIRISLRENSLPEVYSEESSFSPKRCIAKISSPISKDSSTGSRSVTGSDENEKVNNGSDHTIDLNKPGNHVNGVIIEPDTIFLADQSSKRSSNALKKSRSNTGMQSPHSYSRRVFTVKKDLSTLSLFHAQLTDLLLSYPHDEILPPPFPDPFLIATMEESLTASSIAQKSNTFTAKLMLTRLEGESFAYSRNMREQSPKVKEGLRSTGLEIVLEEIQQYLRGIFELIKTIDNDAFIDENNSLYTNNRHENGSNLLTQLGSLIGSFLTTSDTEDRSPQQSFVKPLFIDSIADLPLLSSSTSEFLRSLSSTGFQRPSIIAQSVPDSQKSSTETLPQLNIKINTKNGPCWEPYVRAGLKMRLTFSDDQGGRLSLKSDEELLRSQKARCLGCGEKLSIQWGFLGLDRNYQPCRYYGGLFCRKWCHADDRRQIPARQLLYWDHTAHRVSIQAAKFLDGLLKRPILILNIANPLLYEGVPALRLARNMRGRAVQLIERVLDSDSNGDKADVRETIMNSLGPDQVHLCLSKEVYSMSDLIGVQNGDVLASLETLISALRDKDRTLGVRSGK